MIFLISVLLVATPCIASYTLVQLSCTVMFFFSVLKEELDPLHGKGLPWTFIM